MGASAKEDRCLAPHSFRENDLWKSLWNVKTKSGWTLEKSTRCCRAAPRVCGVRAGDDESYTTLGPFLNDLIQRYHGIDVKTNKHAEETYAPVKLASLPEGAIKSTRIRTARNLKNTPMTCNMTKEERVRIESILKKVFEGFTDDRLKGQYYSLVTMDEAKKNQMIEDHYLFTDDDVGQKEAGAYEDWPHGRGIFMNDDQANGIFIVWVGEEDQIRIMAMNKGSDVQAIWDLFYDGVKAVHEGLKAQGEDFAYLPNLGYLACCSTNLGTGMRASVHVDLPAFKSKHDVQEYVKEKGYKVDIRGTHGEAAVNDGSTVYDVSNQERLGSTCVEQTEAMCNGVAALLKECEGKGENQK